MTENIVSFPSDEEVKQRFEAYCMAVGKVSYAWNYLHERLLLIFIEISGQNRGDAVEDWYAKFSDVVQRDKLKQAIKRHTVWPTQSAQGDLLGLLSVINLLADDRNDAIHAPTTLVIDAPAAGGSRMATTPFSEHPRSKSMLGKDLLREFDWVERATEMCTRYTIKAHRAIQSAGAPWPKELELPDR